MKKYSTYVGMDVHARTIACRLYVVETGEVASKTFANCPTAQDIAQWLEGFPKPAYAAYESGCTAFNLCRRLRELGVDCDVIAVTTLMKSEKQKSQKCDKLDAKAMLAAITNPMSDHTCVWCPDTQTEGARDLARAADEAIQSLKRAKQQMVALLLRHGYVWNEKTPTGKVKSRWTQAFWKWVDSIELPDESSRAALAIYRSAIEANSEIVAMAKKAVAEAAGKPRWKPYVDAISALKGIETQSAFMAAAEFGDFARFKSGRKVSCWLGTVPKNNSSGEKEKHGGITKAGNSRLRRALAEGNANMAARTARKKALPADRVISLEVKTMADKANARLLERYEHLAFGKKMRACKARMAVVSEQVRWVWAIGCVVQKEQEACA